MRKVLQHLHLTLHQQIEEYKKKTRPKLSITTETKLNTTLSAINLSYHNCVEHNKKRLIKTTYGCYNKQHRQITHHMDLNEKQNTHVSDNTPLTTTPDVTDKRRN